jgi:hypothetical protein
VSDIQAGAARPAPAPAVVYPDRIRLSAGAERYLEQLGVDLVTGAVEAWQLPPSLLQFFTFAYEQGKASRQAEVDSLNDEADRLYAEMCRRIPPRHEYQNYADLCRLRGEHARAERHEKYMAAISESLGFSRPEPNTKDHTA